MVTDRSMAEFFEKVVIIGVDPKPAANWMLSDFSRLLNESKSVINHCKITPDHLASLIKLIQDGTISGKIAKTVFEEMFDSGKLADQVVEEKGLKQVSDQGEISTICKQVLEANPSQVEEFKSGKEKVLGFFVGQVMKQSKGKANPQMVNQILKDVWISVILYFL